jgi:preprotein translocase subunit SecG
MVVVVVVAVEVVVVAEAVVEIILVLMTVGRGGDYLDTSGGSSRDYFSGDLLLGVCPADN